MEKYNSPIYMTKRDLLYRVSGEEDFAEVWKELQSNRREKGVKIPLKDQEDKDLFFSLTEELKKKVVAVDDLARNNFFDNLDENEKIEYLNIINKNSYRANKLMNNLFEFSLYQNSKRQ